MSLRSILEQFLTAIDETSSQHYLITPNRRLATLFKTTYNDLQIQQQKTVWPSLNIMPWDNYLKQQYDSWFLRQAVSSSSTSIPVLLNTAQALAIWQQVITNSAVTPPLLQLEAVVQLVSETYDLMCAWRLTHSDLQNQATPDTEIFQQWLTEFQQRLTDQQMILLCEVADFLLSKDLSSLFLQPTGLFFYGFERLTPLHQHWLQTLEKKYAVQHFILNKSVKKAQIQQQGFIDQNSEYRACVAWLQQQLTENPQARLAVVVPELQKNRRQLIKIFREYFCQTNYCLSLTDNLHQWVNMSGGEPLADQPLVEDALYLLEKIPSDQFHLIPQWIDIFIQQLDQADWPGSKVLSSEEHQIQKKFWAGLNQFRSLDLVLNSMSLLEAVQYFRQVLANTLFQIDTESAPIQVLGVLEAEGQIFDGLWMTGLHEQAWPPPVRPNPLLPRSLQKKLAMPNASAENMLHSAQQRLQQFCESASQVILTWPQQVEQQLLSASPLIRNYSMASFFVPPSPIWQVDNRVPLEYFEETHGPAVSAEEKLMGGSYLLQTQAECPFKAFARYRLHAQPEEKKYLGLSPQQRGQLVHSALEKFWRQHKNHENLLALSEEQLEEDLREMIEACFRHCERSEAIQNNSPVFLQLETERLLKILKNWLVLEKQRVPFTVKIIEKSRSVTLAARTLQIRLDRMDVLETGEQIIIDYKTGIPQKMDWLSERLTSPQLPLYALGNEQISGIVHGHLTVDKASIKGLSTTALHINAKQDVSVHKTESWQQHQKHWQQALENLMQAFVTGLAILDPAEGKLTCERCDFSSICRVGEKQYTQSERNLGAASSDASPRNIVFPMPLYP